MSTHECASHFRISDHSEAFGQHESAVPVVTVPDEKAVVVHWLTIGGSIVMVVVDGGWLCWRA